MINLGDLGITSPNVDTTTIENETAPASRVPVLKRGSVLARAVYEIFAGTPVVSVQSPPGAGKTTLLVALIAFLRARTEKSLRVLTPTNRGGADVVCRIHEALGNNENDYSQVRAESTKMAAMVGEILGPDYHRALGDCVSVSTVASALSNHGDPVDVLIVDEAYQVTYADLVIAAHGASQIIMVGDSGQIGPVVTINTRLWEKIEQPPHLSAPQVFEQHSEAVVLSLTETYRLGGTTAKVLAPLYDTAFTSKRPDMWLETKIGTQLPEITGTVIDTNSPYETATISPLIDRVKELSTMVFVDGVTGEKAPLNATDIAVVVSHTAQRSMAEMMLVDAGLAGVIAGTADSLQGGQWKAVVALDPLVGYDIASPHSLSVGRLCVMLSHHRAHPE